MARSQSSIPEEIAAVGFEDIENVVLMGSGVLELAGIRTARDIDLVTTLGNREALLASDSERWRKIVHTRNRLADSTTFQLTSVSDTDNRFDIWRHWYDPRRPLGDRQIYTEELRSLSTQHLLGFYVLRLAELRNLKRHTGRESDQADARLIDHYLSTRLDSPGRVEP